MDIDSNTIFRLFFFWMIEFEFCVLLFHMKVMSTFSFFPFFLNSQFSRHGMVPTPKTWLGNRQSLRLTYLIATFQWSSESSSPWELQTSVSFSDGGSPASQLWRQQRFCTYSVTWWSRCLSWLFVSFPPTVKASLVHFTLEFEIRSVVGPRLSSFASARIVLTKPFWVLQAYETAHFVACLVTKFYSSIAFIRHTHTQATLRFRSF